MWYLPFQKIGPLGSFIQFFAGSRWNCGRSGSAVRRPATSSAAEKFKLRRKCGVAAAARGVDSNLPKNSRREGGKHSFWLDSNTGEIPRCARNDERMLAVTSSKLPRISETSSSGAKAHSKPRRNVGACLRQAG